MIAAILIAIGGGSVRVPRLAFVFAQGIVGCLIARAFTPTILNEILRGWPLFVAGVLSVVVASMVLGWLLARSRVLPGTTAIWGSFPGAATAMTLMCEAFGADPRLVAFMQYLRVVLVAAIASGVARISVGQAGLGPIHSAFFAAVAWGPLIETLALVILSVAIALGLRLRAGPLMVAMALSAWLQDVGWMRIELPPLLLVACYTLVGWSIGSRFTREIVVHVARAFPRVAASILMLIAICGVFAAALVLLTGVTPLTAYLATSPGGADSVAIIAASGNVDTPFVMSMQLGRALFVMFAGPTLARLVVRHAPGLPVAPG
jgi:membrane AbrB-like protein